MALTGFTIVEDTEEPDVNSPVMQPAVEEDEVPESATPTLTGFTLAEDEGDTVDLVTGSPDSYLEYLGQAVKQKTEGLVGATEATAATGVAMGQEALAGLSGLVTSPFIGPDKATELADKVRKFIPDYTPFSEQGKKDLEAMANVMEPFAKGMENAREWAGGTVQRAFEESGFAAENPNLSSAISTAAFIAPDLALEAFGYLLPKGSAKVISKIDDARTSFKAAKLMKEAVSVEETFGAAKQIYQALDNSGIMLKMDDFVDFAEKTYLDMSKNGMRKTTTSKAYGAITTTLDMVKEYAEQGGIPLAKLDELREVAKGAASSLTSQKEAALGMRMINAIDDFVDGATSDMLIGTEGKNVAESFQLARDLWGRGRRTEILQRAFQKAKDNKAGFIKSITNEYNKLLQNDKTFKLFSPEEQNAIRTVAKGSKGTNMVKALASLGFYDGDGAGLAILRPAAAYGTATYLGGPALGFAVPIIGQVSKPLAKALVANDARLAEAVILAGKDGMEIAKQYVKYVPKAERSAQGLAELLLTRGASTAGMLGKTSFIDDALYIMNKGATAYSSAAILDSLAAIGKPTEETKE